MSQGPNGVVAPVITAIFPLSFDMIVPFLIAKSGNGTALPSHERVGAMAFGYVPGVRPVVHGGALASHS